MDKQRSTEIRVGIFVAIGLFLSMLVIFMLGGSSSLFERYYHLIARFENTSGLTIGTGVSLMGIPVGTVEEIRFSEDLSDQRPLVKLKIVQKYSDRIRQDSRASIITQGLLGDKVVQISIGSPGARELKNGDFIEIKKGLSIESVADKGTETLDELASSIKKINQILEDVREKPGLIHSLLYDPEGAELVKNLSAVTASAKDMVQEIRHGKGVLHDLIFSSKKSSLSENLSAGLENFKKTSESLKLIAEKIRKGEGTIGGFLSDPTVYQDLKTLLGKANRSKLIKAVIQHTMSKNEKDTLK